MLSSTASRVLLKKVQSNAFNGQTLRLASSVPVPTPQEEERRQIHTTPVRKADATAEEPAAVAPPAGGLAARFASTAEVTVSKIFPAGFGWQTASVVAENNLGFAADSLNFALTTGAGDAMGVFGGHMIYYTAKKNLVDSEIDLTSELQTGILLGSAAFCSGTAWQPVVDALQGANLSFLSVFAGTWAGCGLAFYAGLRMGRTILSGPLAYIQEPTYENSKNDASLSVAIGSATAFFAGTDVAYLPEQNFLVNIVGIQDGTPDVTACAIAGTSTSLGFMTAQSTFNLIYPAGRCWND